MSHRLSTAKKAGLFFAECVVFLPKGIVFPIVGFIDQSRACLRHQQITCVFCQENNLANGKFSKRTTQFFKRLTNRIAHNSARFFQLFITCFNYIFPRSWQKKLSKIAQPFWQKIKDPLSKLMDSLSKQHNEFAWYIVIPLVSLAGCGLIWGWAIIPEIYIFLMASNWSGLILNCATNLLVRHKHAEEWLYLKKIRKIFRKPYSILSLKKHIAPLISLFNSVLLGLFLGSLFGKVDRLLSYTLGSLLGWVGIYILTKVVVDDEAPMMLNQLERHLNRKSSQGNRGARVENLLWVVSYQTFRATGSVEAQAKYDRLHETLVSHRKKSHICSVPKAYS